MIDLLTKVYDLKDEKRTGWELRGIEDPETVAGHSWGTAYLILVYGPKEDINMEKALKIALVHDMPECKVGDIPSRPDSEEKEVDEGKKKELEQEAMRELTQDLDEENLFKLWNEYKENQSDEAVFVKDMDKIDMCLQALKYEKEGRYDKDEESPRFNKYERLDEFFATTEDCLKTNTGERLFQDIKIKYEKTKNR